MNDPTQKSDTDASKDLTQNPETKATSAGNAGAAAKPAGAGAPADAAIKAETTKETKEPKAKKAEATPEATVVVTGPEKGRWRAGRKFTREPSSIPLGDLKDGELEKLLSDPELMVQLVNPPH